MVKAAPNYTNLAKRVVRLFPEADRSSRAEELASVLDAAEQAGQPASLLDVGSLGLLVGRTWLRLGLTNLFLVLAGLPLASFAFVAIISVYERHFWAWDVIEDVPSSSASVRAIRTGVELVGIGSIPVCLFAGFRCLRSLRDGRFGGPLVFLAAVLFVHSQAGLFVERTPWFARGRLEPSDVDVVSGYSLLVYATAVMVPIVFVGYDVFACRRQNISQEIGTMLLAESASSARHVGAAGVGIMMVAPLFMPLLSLVGVPLVWASPTWSSKRKLGASIFLIPAFLSLTLGLVLD